MSDQFIHIYTYHAALRGLAQRRLLVLPLLVAAVAHRLPEDDELGRQGRRCPWSWPPSPSTWPWSASPLLQQVEDHVLIFLNGRHVQAALACNAAMQAEDKWQIKTDRKLTVPDLDVVRQLLVDPEQVAAEAGHAVADVEHHGEHRPHATSRCEFWISSMEYVQRTVLELRATARERQVLAGHLTVRTLSSVIVTLVCLLCRQDL